MRHQRMFYTKRSHGTNLPCTLVLAQRLMRGGRSLGGGDDLLRPAAAATTNDAAGEDGLDLGDGVAAFSLHRRCFLLRLHHRTPPILRLDDNGPSGSKRRAGVFLLGLSLEPQALRARQVQGLGHVPGRRRSPGTNPAWPPVLA